MFDPFVFMIQQYKSKIKMELCVCLIALLYLLHMKAQQQQQHNTEWVDKTIVSYFLINRNAKKHKKKNSSIHHTHITQIFI